MVSCVCMPAVAFVSSSWGTVIVLFSNKLAQRCNITRSWLALGTDSTQCRTSRRPSCAVRIGTCHSTPSAAQVAHVAMGVAQLHPQSCAGSPTPILVCKTLQYAPLVHLPALNLLQGGSAYGLPLSVRRTTACMSRGWASHVWPATWTSASALPSFPRNVPAVLTWILSLFPCPRPLQPELDLDPNGVCFLSPSCL